MSERLVLRWVAVVGVGLSGVAAAQTQKAGQKTDAGPAAAETRLTKDQQTAVLGDLNEILKFVSADSGLTIKKPVKGIYLTREGVNAELRRKMDEDEGTKRMERSELVLKKFGLLDRDFHLRPFLLSLLTEQIAGFYDGKTKVMNLLDWVPEDEQKPVMAHELTHALQDQRVGLEKWNDQEVKGVAKDVNEDNHHILMDETDTAREAVLEGQAMVTFADYEIQQQMPGKRLKDMPEVGEKLRAGAGDVTNSPVMARAPLLLQQALVFPYVEGLNFEQTLQIKQGTDRAFTQTLDHPPNSSFEIMNPQLYLEHVPVPVLHMPDIHPVLEAAGYAPYDIGVMGELDVRITTELFGGRPLAEALAPAWAGGIYYAAQKKAAANDPVAKDSTASLGLIYTSRWKNEDSARSFFTVYDSEMPRKYSGLKRRKKDEKDSTERVYSTSEGDVLLTLNGTGVFVGEGFDVAVARKLRDAIDAAQGSGPLQQAGVQGSGSRVQGLESAELAGGLARWVGGFGMMRVAGR